MDNITNLDKAFVMAIYMLMHFASLVFIIIKCCDKDFSPREYEEDSFMLMGTIVLGGVNVLTMCYSVGLIYKFITTM